MTIDPMLFWNVILTMVIAPVFWAFRQMFTEVKRLQILLNKTREDYATKFELKDEIENCEDPDIIYDRFYKNMTLTEIAEKKNTSYETIRNKIKKNLKMIKNRIS